MEEKKQPDNGDYQFIREKIVKKRKGKWKRALLFIGGTVLLAVLFGFVARLVFSMSEPYVHIILGMSPTPAPTQPEKTQIALSSTTPSPSATPVPTATPKPTPTTGETVATNAPEPTSELPPVTEAPQPTESGEVTKTPEPTAAPVIVEQRIDATLNDFVTIYQDIRRIATNAGTAIATVTAVANGVDWFEETYEDVLTTTSGIIVGDNGVELLLLVTYDRIAQADRIEVSFAGYTADAAVIAVDADYNLAVLGIDYSKIPSQSRAQISYATFGESYYMITGTPVIAIGNPNGYRGSFELGILTARNSYAYIMDNRLDLLNTSIADNPNGDGVLINTSGEIVGIITHKFKEELNENINTVIGISRLKPVIETLVNEQRLKVLGVVSEEVPQELLTEIGIDAGLYVREVAEGSPAELAGIRKGDILTAIDGSRLQFVNVLNNTINQMEEGQEAQITLVRMIQQKYTEITADVTIGLK